MMVSSCPRSWKEIFTRYKCENTNYDDKTIDAIPVTSSATNTTYRNVYCAACNGEHLTMSISWWDIEVSCSWIDPSENLTAVEMFTECNAIAYHPPKSSFSGRSGSDFSRFCQYTKSEGCSGKLAKYDQETSRKCARYFAPILALKYGSDVMYKNAFCALCNDAEPATFKCPITDTFRNKLPLPADSSRQNDTILLKIEATSLSSSQCILPESLPIVWKAHSFNNKLISKVPSCVKILQKPKNLTVKPKLQCSTHSFCSAPDKANPSPLYCNCYENCVLYGDCCYDFPVSRVDSSVYAKKLQCQSPFPRGTGSDQTISMIASCSETWKDQDINELCKNVDFQRAEQSMPVTSSETNLVYRNIYCAACNGASNMISWRVTFNCTSGNSEYKDIDNITKNCRIDNYIPPYTSVHGTCTNTDCVKSIRPCSPIYNSTCPLRTDSETRLKCARYFAPVQVSEKTSTLLYKNEFCALCHGHSINNLQCPHMKNIFHSFYPNIEYDPVTHSFSTIFNYGELFQIDFSDDVESPGQSCPKGYTILKWKKGEGTDTNSANRCVKSWKKKKFIRP